MFRFLSSSSFFRVPFDLSYCRRSLTQHTLTFFYYNYVALFSVAYNAKHDNTTLPNYITYLFPLKHQSHLISAIQQTTENRRIFQARGAHTFRLVRCTLSVHYEYPTICCLAITLLIIMSSQVAQPRLPSQRQLQRPWPTT